MSLDRRTFLGAARLTIPVCAAYLGLGAAYGVYMRSLGFGFWWPVSMAFFIYGGSLEFLAAAMLLGAFAPWQTLAVAVLVQARHLFYGISMLEKYNGAGWKLPFLIFGLSDETFAVLFSEDVPAGSDRYWHYLLVTWLDRAYWVVGGALGWLCGAAVKTEGLDFVMTAMFAAILVDQCRKRENRIPAAIGLAVSLVCLLAFGAEKFLLPSMGMIALILAFCKPRQRSAA